MSPRKAKVPGRTCSYCAAPLPMVRVVSSAGVTGTGYGYRGEALFCDRDCGYEYGRHAALEALKGHA